MNTRLMKLNAALATKMLRANSDENRALRRSVVDALKAAWQRGEYLTSHQGIAFDTSGKLVDGQHRLTALSEMPPSFGVEMMVTHGVEPEAVKVMDIGLKRKAADVLNERAPVVEVARFLATIHTGSSQTTPSLLAPFVEEVREPMTELLAECSHKAKVFSSAPFRSAAILTQLMGGDFSYAKLVYRAMVNGDFDLMPRAGKALYRSVATGRVTTEHPHDTFARGMRIFDPSAAELQKIQIGDAGAVVADARRVLHNVVKLHGQPERARRRTSGNGQHQHAARH